MVMETLWNLIGHCSAFCPTSIVPSLLPAEVLTVNSRTYRVIKQLGEGGYAFVYLAKELPTSERPSAASDAVAIKKIIAASGEKLSAAKKEVEVLLALAHAHCLHLLDHAIHPSSSSSSLAYNVLLVFPAFEDGTLADELERLAAAGRQLSSHHVLDIFRQVCSGVGHMHSKGYAHMDIKPHNILIRRPHSSRGSSKAQRHRQQRQQQLRPPSAGQMAMTAGAARCGGADGASDDDADEQQALTADAEAGGSVSVGRGYEAVLTDFGSARAVPMQVASRAEALTVQEDAEAHCTATFRAPELFDVPSHCTLDGRMDVWALGCTLYAIMYGASPFQQAVDQGASLALAVMNCRIPWPKPPALRYPQELHSLVGLCLTAEHGQRPTVTQLLERVQELMAAGLHDAS
ncbi:kinase-like domain-containing protein [Scenedesmus sp. NREL 46B-D3]|nr:kinase-like domain-containing protein [Scenedesmus sp. NREL 46B-D3]